MAVQPYMGWIPIKKKKVTFLEIFNPCNWLSILHHSWKTIWPPSVDLLLSIVDKESSREMFCKPSSLVIFSSNDICGRIFKSFSASTFNSGLKQYAQRHVPQSLALRFIRSKGTCLLKATKEHSPMFSATNWEYRIFKDPSLNYAGTFSLFLPGILSIFFVSGHSFAMWSFFKKPSIFMHKSLFLLFFRVF